MTRSIEEIRVDSGERAHSTGSLGRPRWTPWMPVSRIATVIAALLVTCSCADSPNPKKPNILYFLVDTLRADQLGAYGMTPSVTPNLDAFAADAVVYNAVAQSSWTKPSVASLMSGFTPNRHKTNVNEAILPNDIVTTAEALKEAGYSTAAIVTNPYVGSKFNFQQGFDHFEDMPGSSDDLVSRAIELMSTADLDEPFFLYVHTQDPHAPYRFRKGFSERIAPGVDPSLGGMEFLESHPAKVSQKEKQSVMQLYAAEVSFMDRSFGLMLEWLKATSLADSTLIVFLSDHGEQFWEHGRHGHGLSLHHEEVVVPLIVRDPLSRSAGRSENLARLIDLMPTSLETAGLAIPDDLPGRSLRGAETEQDHAAYSLLMTWGNRMEAITTSDWKLVSPTDSESNLETNLLYNLVDDPFESTNVYSEQPIVGEHLMGLLRAHRDLWGLDVEVEKTIIDEKTIKALKALGYVQ